MTAGQLTTEEAKAARTVAAYAMVRAMLARDTWTMARILDRWAIGPGTEGMELRRCCGRSWSRACHRFG
jgi:hypothetical protein